MAKAPTLAFLRTESGAGAVLGLAALAGLAMANSSWAQSYAAFVGHPVPLRLAGFAETLTVAGWVRQGLMAAFFLVIGLEVKYEVLRGEYQGQSYALPVATIYVQAINHATEHRSQIATILTQQGVEPPDVSGWAWDATRAG